MDTLWPSFEDFWNAYQKKIARPKCEKKWNKLKQSDKEKIMQHVPIYVQSTPEKEYRKHPYTYLHNESWNDEVIFKHGKPTRKEHRTEFINSEIDAILAHSRGLGAHGRK